MGNEFITLSKMKYNGKVREFEVYEDGTAIDVKTRKKILLSERDYNIVLQKMAEAQTKQRGREVEDKTPKEPKIQQPVSRVKAIVVVSLYVLAVVGSIFGATFLMQTYESQVEIAAIASPIAKDAELTLGHLAPLPMSQSTYQRLSSATGNDIVLWSDVDSIVGSRMRFDISRGQYILKSVLSNTPVITNPWETAAGRESKIYTIPFDSDTVYSVIPGAHLKMYVITTEVDRNGNVFLTEYGGVKNSEIQTTVDALAASKPSIDLNVAEAEDGSNANVTGEGDEDEAGVESEISGNAESATDTLNKVKTLFDDITVVDLKNAEGQSIYNHYLTLARMDSASREGYLKEMAASGTARQYLKKFTATAIVFSLNNEQTSELNKITQMPNTSIDYAVLPSATVEATDEQHSLYLTFSEIRDQISVIFGNLVEERR